MTPAEEVITLPGWRWMPGMRLASGQRIDGAQCGRPVRYSDRPAEWSTVGETARVEEYTMPPYIPDLDDAATVGCLLALVREVRRAPLGQVSPVITIIGEAGTAWCWYDNVGEERPAKHPTEVAALVAALRPVVP